MKLYAIKKIQVSSAIASFVLLFFILSLFVLESIDHERASVKENIRILNNRLLETKRLLSQKTMVEGAYKKTFVLDPGEKQDILKFLEGMLSNRSIRVLDIRKQSIDTDNAVIDRVELVLESKQQAYISFLHDIYSSSYLLRINAFNIEPAEEKGFLSIRMTLEYIVLPE